MPAGRPTKYDASYHPEHARKFCMLGATNDALAEAFEVVPSTIDAWIATYPEFSGSIKAGRQIADAEVASKLFHRATGYEHKAVKIAVDAKSGESATVDYIEHYAPDTTAAIFWLKNRRPDLWRDRIVNEHTGANGDAIKIETNDIDVARRIAFALAKGAAATDGSK